MYDSITLKLNVSYDVDAHVRGSTFNSVIVKKSSVRHRVRDIISKGIRYRVGVNVLNGALSGYAPYGVTNVRDH